MFTLVLGIHLLLCVLLIGLVLLQQGKGADAGAVLGGGSNTVFGAGGATSLMVKVTTIVAVCFMVTSIFLVRGYSSLIEQAPVGVQLKDTGLVDSATKQQPASAEEPGAAKPAEAAPAAAAKTSSEKKGDEATGSQTTSPANSAGGSAAPAAAPAQKK